LAVAQNIVQATTWVTALVDMRFTDLYNLGGIIVSNTDRVAVLGNICDRHILPHANVGIVIDCATNISLSANSVTDVKTFGVNIF
jgi:hypothetical protein